MNIAHDRVVLMETLILVLKRPVGVNRMLWQQSLQLSIIKQGEHALKGKLVFDWNALFPDNSAIIGCVTVYVFFMNSSELKPHIGKAILEQLHQQGRTVTWLARQIPCDRSNLYKIFEKRSVDPDLLFRISSCLNYDFFSLYSASLKK